MKTTEKIILKKEIELIIEYSINQDFTKIKDIMSQQKDANILLYGFEFSHKHDVNFGTSYATSLREVDYSINLLELLSSNPRFHNVLAEMLNYPLVIQDLISEEKNIEQHTHMTLKSMIKNEAQNKYLWKKIKKINPLFDSFVENEINTIKQKNAFKI